MADLASVLGCSLPTAQKLTARYPEMPVIERGGMGKSWRFDAEAVVEFLRERKREEESARIERGELLAQLVLPIGKPVDAAGREISYSDQLKAAQLRAALREEEKETGLLVSTVELGPKLRDLLRSLANNQSAALSAVQREHNIPEPVMAAIRAKFDNARTAFVRDAGALLTGPAPANDGVIPLEEFRLAAE